MLRQAESPLPCLGCCNEYRHAEAGTNLKGGRDHRYAQARRLLFGDKREVLKERGARRLHALEDNGLARRCRQAGPCLDEPADGGGVFHLAVPHVNGQYRDRRDALLF